MTKVIKITILSPRGEVNQMRARIKVYSTRALTWIMRMILWITMPKEKKKVSHLMVVGEGILANGVGPN